MYYVESVGSQMMEKHCTTLFVRNSAVGSILKQWRTTVLFTNILTYRICALQIPYHINILIRWLFYILVFDFCYTS